MPRLAPASSRDDDRRTCGRLRTEQLQTDLGQVVNLSGSGMRVLARQSRLERLGETLDITIAGLGERITVRATIVWSRRIGFRRHVLGFRFADLPQRERSRLTELARTAIFLPGLGNQNLPPSEAALAP